MREWAPDIWILGLETLLNCCWELTLGIIYMATTSLRVRLCVFEEFGPFWPFVLAVASITTTLALLFEDYLRLFSTYYTVVIWEIDLLIWCFGVILTWSVTMPVGVLFLYWGPTLTERGVPFVTTRASLLCYGEPRARCDCDPDGG